ncbi:MAG: hypothetical protein ACREL1_00860 [bacterium]
MKAVKYPESINCPDCHSPVKMVNCRFLSQKVKGKLHVEFDVVCVACGLRSSANRDWEYLQYSEREFCWSKKLVAPETVGSKAKGR